MFSYFVVTVEGVPCEVLQMLAHIYEAAIEMVLSAYSTKFMLWRKEI